MSWVACTAATTPGRRRPELGAVWYIGWGPVHRTTSFCKCMRHVYATQVIRLVYSGVYTGTYSDMYSDTYSACRLY